MFFIPSFLEQVSLEGHFATNFYQNLTVIEKSVQNKKYQTLSQQTLLLSLLRPRTNILWVILKFYDLFWISPCTMPKKESNKMYQHSKFLEYIGSFLSTFFKTKKATSSLISSSKEQLRKKDIGPIRNV